MTGPPEPDPAGPDPEQARVRALLADLGTDGAHPPGPVPDDVVARLDATLADLTAPAASAAPGRRRGRGLLVAAALVLVVGAGGVTTAGLVGGSQDETATGGGESAGSSADESLRAPAVPELGRTGFGADVAALLATRTTVEQARPTLAPCASPPGRGTLVPVRFEGEPAVLVARPARGSRRVVEAWTCDASRVLATTRVPAPPR